MRPSLGTGRGPSACVCLDADVRQAGEAGRARPRGQAGRAQPEQLEAVVVDAIAGLSRDVADDRAQARVVDLGGPAAARADDVMMVGGLAADIGVLARRQIEPLDGSELLEDLEGPEDRRPPDAEPATRPRRPARPR